ncbi:MAG: type II/IV secretion system protein [Helicobacteraceae bacterium]|nr:type II/IV secretion system protein [Helicobacteraceae bacterium]
MLNLSALHDPYLEAYEPENIDVELALRNYLLFSVVENETTALMSEQYLAEASSYYSKLSTNMPLKVLDEDSYERLYNKFLELRSEKAIESMNEEDGSDESEGEEDISLTEFLRTSSDILTSEESAPIIKFVNALFFQAIKKRASDIHIEVHENRGEVRFRIDGVLSKNVDLELKVVSLIISRIKVISNLDISEKRIPQDGRTQIKISGKTIDVRVSILPTFHGERVVMRILMQNDDIPTIYELGLGDDIIGEVKKLLLNSHGMILVTGPTGSGKTTSLHAFLKEVDTPGKNLITIEDPVEYKSDTISQIQVNEKVGLTFATAIRSILRQDPDTIMIGEIRDEETANIAIRAALTGHLVFSTLHTNSAAATISRLADMKIEPFLISSAVLGVLAQRLVRILCTKCKERDYFATKMADEFSFKTTAEIYKSKGCKECAFSGYSSRESVGELMIMDNLIKKALKVTTDELTIKKLLKRKGMKTISDKLIILLEDGRTSLDEAIRIGLAHA